MLVSMCVGCSCKMFYYSCHNQVSILIIFNIMLNYIKMSNKVMSVSNLGISVSKYDHRLIKRPHVDFYAYINNALLRDQQSKYIHVTRSHNKFINRRTLFGTLFETFFELMRHPNEENRKNKKQRYIFELHRVTQEKNQGTL